MRILLNFTALVFAMAGLQACTVASLENADTRMHASNAIVEHEAAFSDEQDTSINLATNSKEDLYAAMKDRGLVSPDAVQLEEGVWRRTEDGQYIHAPSLLVCPPIFHSNAALRNITHFNEDGTDVACHYYTDDRSSVFTFYASYYPGVSKRAHFQQAIAAIKQKLPHGSRSTTVVSIEIGNKEGAAEFSPLVAGYLINSRSTEKIKTSVWLETKDDWHYKVRATHPAQQASEIEIDIALTLFTMLSGVFPLQSNDETT